MSHSTNNRINTVRLIYFQSIIIFLILNGCKKDSQTPAPGITSFTPASGKVGTAVTVSGSNFSTTPGNNLVKFNGTQAILTSATTTSLEVTVPPQAETGEITVELNGSIATSSTDFIVLNPTITDFSPSSGIVGNTVTISGTNFDPVLTNNIVKFNGIVATITSGSSTQLVVTVPENATTGTISIAVSPSVITSNNNFTILSPTISSVWPNIGSVGTSVVITGTNFSTNSAFNHVKFNNTEATVTNATATTITTTAPSGATSGKITVKVGPNTATSSTDFQLCSGSAELVISNLIISSIDANRISFYYEYDLTNVGDTAADITIMTNQAYVSTDNADNGGDLAAAGWPLGDNPLNSGEKVHLQFHANIASAGTVDTYPYLVVKISGPVPECNTSNNTAIRSILN